MQFTVFCRHCNGTGTTWIDTVTCANQEDAHHIAKRRCVEEWYGEDAPISRLDDIAVIGMAEGDVKILFWEDQE